MLKKENWKWKNIMRTKFKIIEKEKIKEQKKKIKKHRDIYKIKKNLRYITKIKKYLKCYQK